MNKGLGDEKIFLSDEMKQKYIQLLAEKSNSSRIRIFCYCVMDNHFHLVLENTSGKLSDFMKQLNCSYGFYYRKSVGGKGYVFHDRFRSTLIQDEAYLLTAIKYVLQNPVEAGISPNFLDYTWSSARLYFRRVNQSFMDMEFVENLFISKRNFIESVNKFDIKNMIDYPTKFGRILGTEKFKKEAEEKYDRRKTESIKNNKRRDDMYFESIEKVYYEFERKKNIRISEIDINSHKGRVTRI
jgi:REP element-mobilizing transposase RayT